METKFFGQYNEATGMYELKKASNEYWPPRVIKTCKTERGMWTMLWKANGGRYDHL
jgi:hypothetical protein